MGADTPGSSGKRCLRWRQAVTAKRAVPEMTGQFLLSFEEAFCETFRKVK
jgi:hypothetical protein